MREEEKPDWSHYTVPGLILAAGIGAGVLLGRFLAKRVVGTEIYIASLINIATLDHPGLCNDHLDLFPANGLRRGDNIYSMILRQGFKGADLGDRVCGDCVPGQDNGKRVLPAELSRLLEASYAVNETLNGAAFPEGMQFSDAYPMARQASKNKGLPLYVGRSNDSLARIVRWHPFGWQPRSNYRSSRVLW